MSVEWKIRFIEVKGGYVAFLGKWQIGNVRYTKGNCNQRHPHWVAFLNIPGCIGPIAREATDHLAKIELTVKVKSWLSMLSETPSLACPVDLREVVSSQTARGIRARQETTPEPERLRRIRPAGPPPPKARRTRQRR